MSVRRTVEGTGNSEGRRSPFFAWTLTSLARWRRVAALATCLVVDERVARASLDIICWTETHGTGVWSYERTARAAL